MKRRRLDLLSIEIESDSPRDNQNDYLPSDFPFALYQPPPPPSLKRQRVSPPPFPYFDPDSPTFGLAAPPLLMDEPTSYTMDSTVSFTVEILSPDITRTMTPSTGVVTPPSQTRDPNIFVGVNPTVSSIRAMVSTMLGTPPGFDGASTPYIVGASHSSNIRATFTLTINPSFPQSMGEQPVIGTGSLFSLQSSLPQPTLFLETFSMWNKAHIGNSPLQQQSSPSQNPITNSQFTASSLGMFHPRSGGFPPFPSGNPNMNPTLGGSSGFPFGWNWNSNTLHGQQNVGLAYSRSSSHLLGNNPSLGNVGGTPPLGPKSSGSQAILTPQQNVRINPYSAQ